MPAAEVVIVAHGHANVLATHPTTLQFTKDGSLSRKGDCIIAVSSNKAMSDFDPSLKECIRHDESKIRILIEAGGTTEIVHARGSSHLILSHPTDFVVRKGNYICSRTLAIRADKAACDLSRTLVEKLRNPRQEVRLAINVAV